MRNALVVVVLVMGVFLAGCTGHMYIQDGSMIEPTDQGKIWQGKKKETAYIVNRGKNKNASSLKIWDNWALGHNYIQAAEAYGIYKNSEAQADLTKAIAEQIRTGQAASFAGRYVGIIVNQDPSRVAYVHHPSRSEIRKIKPGAYSVFLVTEIPDYITVRFSGEKRNVRRKIWKKSKVYNGIPTVFGARIES